MFWYNDRMKIKRLKLKKWLEAEQLKIQFIEGLQAGEDVSEVFHQYIRLTTGKKTQRKYWMVASQYFMLAMLTNAPLLDLALLRQEESGETREVWEYEQRTWYLWSSMLARNFGWSLEYIAELDVDDALAYLQEFLVKEQLDKEFWYGLSELAYPYNEGTQKHEFKPLERPDWMQMKEIPQHLQPPTVKIAKKYMPIGAVVKWDNREIKDK